MNITEALRDDTKALVVQNLKTGRWLWWNDILKMWIVSRKKDGEPEPIITTDSEVEAVKVLTEAIKVNFGQCG